MVTIEGVKKYKSYKLNFVSATNTKPKRIRILDELMNGHIEFMSHSSIVENNQTKSTTLTLSSSYKSIDFPYMKNYGIKHIQNLLKIISENESAVFEEIRPYGIEGSLTQTFRLSYGIIK